MTYNARLGSASMFDAGLRNIADRQARLASLQDNLTSGKKVVRPSDDPTASAQAERALTRLSRIQADQRALDTQRNSISIAESTLGDVTAALQSFRELAVNAGNGAFTNADRRTLVGQLSGLRDQIFTLSNRTDTNGMPLFGALGSALAPFVNQTSPAGYTFQGLPGQLASNAVSIASALDGDSAFMFQSQRDGVYNVTLSGTPGPSKLSSGNVTVTDPTQVTGNTYGITFTGVDTTTTPGSTTVTYDVVDTVSGATTSGTATYVDGHAFMVNEMPGLALSFTGTPAVGEQAQVQPQDSIFSVLDSAIRDLGNANNNTSAIQAVGQALHNIDLGLNRVSAVRGQAGNLLNRADTISGNQETRTIQLEADRSRAEDLDMVKGISDFQTQQTGYQAALQSYAQVQKLSLFNFIS